MTCRIISRILHGYECDTSVLMNLYHADVDFVFVRVQSPQKPQNTQRFVPKKTVRYSYMHNIIMHALHIAGERGRQTVPVFTALAINHIICQLLCWWVLPCFGSEGGAYLCDVTHSFSRKRVLWETYSYNLQKPTQLVATVSELSTLRHCDSWVG